MKSFFRFLMRNKLFTSVNVFGLAVSIMFVILIGDYAYKLLTVDHFYKNADRILLLGNETKFYSDYPGTRILPEKFPEVESVCSVASENVKISTPENGNDATQSLFSTKYIVADSTFFTFFSFKFLAGDRSSALQSTENVVLTKDMARKLFDDVDVIGKVVRLKRSNEGFFTSSGEKSPEYIDMVVSGVIEDIDNTILPNDAGIITRIENSKKLYGLDYGLWGWVISGGDITLKTFVMERPNTDLTTKLDDISELFHEVIPSYKRGDYKEVTLTRLKDVMLSPLNHGDGMEKGNRGLMTILLSVSFLILLFAVINYINLTIAQTGARAKEMASRKLLGASKREISYRLVFESVIITLVAFVIALILAQMAEPYAARLIQGKISIFGDLSVAKILVFILFIIILGTISGIIPSFAISRFKPIDVVKGTFKFKSKMVFSKVFIIFQNTITIAMIAATITIYLQLNHLINEPLGFNKENILNISTYKLNSKEKTLTLKKEIDNLACVEEVGMSTGHPLGAMSMSSVSSEEGASVWIASFIGDDSFFNMMGFELLKDFHPSGKATYLNEKAFQLLNLNDSTTSFSIWDPDVSYLLGGVYKNFKITNFITGDNYMPVELTNIKDFERDDASPSQMQVKISGDKHEAYKAISDIYRQLTDEPMEATYFEDIVSSRFKKEKDLSTIVLIFTIIAIIISSLGLLAMSTYFIRQRRSEVGVRKIMGSTRGEILSLLLWKFLRLLLISFVIAIPVAYYFINNWLQGYSYRIHLSPWIFVAAGTFTFVIATCTLLWQSLIAINSNPAEAIKAE